MNPKATKQEVKPRNYQFGNTIVVIHSRLAWMSQEEQRIWYQEQWEKGNPVLRQIADVMFED